MRLTRKPRDSNLCTTFTPHLCFATTWATASFTLPSISLHYHRSNSDVLRLGSNTTSLCAIYTLFVSNGCNTRYNFNLPVQYVRMCALRRATKLHRQNAIAFQRVLKISLMHVQVSNIISLNSNLLVQYVHMCALMRAIKLHPQNAIVLPLVLKT